MKPLIAALLVVLVIAGMTLKKPFSKQVFRTNPSTITPSTATVPESQNAVQFQAQAPEETSQGYEIQIFLLGIPTQLIDAADLSVHVGENLRLVSVQPGLSFPQYPRISVDSSQAVVTGVAGLLGNNQKAYGKPNHVFATFMVEKIDATLPAELIVNTSDTKAYFNGEPILNQKQSLKEIKL